jgi:hypothetical protein
MGVVPTANVAGSHDLLWRQIGRKLVARAASRPAKRFDFDFFGENC